MWREGTPRELSHVETVEMQREDSSISEDDEIKATVTYHGPTRDSEKHGWIMYEWAIAPVHTVYLIVLGPIFLKWLAEGAANGGLEEGSLPGVDAPTSRRTVPGLGISAGSYPSFLNVVGLIVEFIALLTIAPLGDFGRNRHHLLHCLTLVGGFLLCLNVFCFEPQMWWFAGLLRILIGTIRGLCLVFYNALLPQLTANDPELVQISDGEERMQEEHVFADRMSATGNIVGYAGGVVILSISATIIYGTECVTYIEACSNFDINFWPCLCFVFCGLWWMSFSRLAFTWLRPFDNPAPPDDSLCHGWRKMESTILRLRKFSQTKLFLISNWMFSDASTTMLVTCPLLLESYSVLSLTEITICAILVCCCTLIGNIFWRIIQWITGLSAKALLIISLVMMVFISGWTCAKLFLHIHFYISWRTQLYLIAGMLGLVIASLQSFSRSLFAVLSPVGGESSLFGLYELTDKGSYGMGQVATIIIHNRTNGYSGVFVYCFILFCLSIPLLAAVDVERGMEDSGRTTVDPFQDLKDESGDSDDDD